MAKFGKASKSRLATADKRLQRVANEVIKTFDHTIVEGHRGEDAQNAAFAKGASQLPWPLGKHNSKPSKAIDVAPYPIEWGGAESGAAWNKLTNAEKATVRRRNEAARQRFVYLAGFYVATGLALGIKLRWGGDWNSDRDTRDEGFRDLGHIEVIDE